MKVFYVTKVFEFDSAHYLEKYKGKCEALHGHTYKLEVTVKGVRGSDDMVIDFVELKKIVNELVISRLDHTLLNESLGINPSAENIADWIWHQLSARLSTERYSLYRVRVWESPTSFVDYYGSEEG